MESSALEGRLKHLERKILCLTILCGLLTITLTFIAIGSNTRQVRAAEQPGVLRAKGLIIDDAQGRARILLGAPFPSVHDRLRQDTTTTAMLFLDEQGHDRFSIGEKMPAQLNGKVSPQFHRIGAGYGLTIYDLKGNERGGMGFLSNGRAAIALDRPNGDAWGAMVDDKSGFAGTMTLYSPEVANDTNGIIAGTVGKRAFISLKSVTNIPRASFAIDATGTPSFELFDKAGKSGTDLLHAASGVHEK